MPIQNASDSQKVDFLWKKIVYGAAKTDIAGNIDATQEPIASPLQIRADKILQDSASIPAVIPGSNSSVVTIYPTTFPVECISTAGIPTPTLTWQTGQTFWVPPEFGSTYQVKVYIAPSGNAANVASKGTQVFATGSGSNDLWVFDYQSGILNFNSNNTPYNGASPISFTGNSVYVSGAVYAGAFGLPTASNIANIILGNITFSGNTISSNQANGNIMIFAPGQGIVQFVGQDAIGLPSGDDATRPLYPEIGYTRYNTDRQSIEYYDGNSWLAPGAATISSEVINPDGSANTYTLGSNTTVDSVLVSINGTLQQPIYSYNIVNNNQITFTETPLTSDIIEVRFIAVSATSVTSLRYGPATAVTLDLANVNVTGNILPSANVTYSLGSESLQWKDLWVSGNTVYIGGSALTVANGQLSIGGNTVGSAVTYSNVNVKAYTETMGFTNYSNVNVAAYLGNNITVGGNVTAGYFLGNGSQLTGLPTGYSNVQVTTYLPTYTGAVQSSNVQTTTANIQATTAATNTATGALRVMGGVGIAGNLYAAPNAAAVFGAGIAAGTANVYITGGTSHLIVTTQAYRIFADATYPRWGIGTAANAYSFFNIWPVDNHNYIESGSRPLHIGFAGGAGGNVLYMDPVTGRTVLTTNTASTSTTTGALVIAGGIGVGRDAVFGGNITVASGGLINSAGNILSTGLSVFGNTRIGSLATPGALHTIIGNVDVSGAGTEYFNIGGNIMAIQGSFGSINVNGNISGNTNGFSLGYRDLPQITAGNVTLALTDASKHFYANTPAPTIITVPSNANVAFPIGTTIVIVNRGSGSITIQNQGAGAPFLYLAGNATTTTSRTLQQYGMATLVKTETNLWFINGTGLL